MDPNEAAYLARLWDTFQLEAEEQISGLEEIIVPYRTRLRRAR